MTMDAKQHGVPSYRQTTLKPYMQHDYQCQTITVHVHGFPKVWVSNTAGVHALALLC